MNKCIICKKELPGGTKAPVCKHHRAQVKEKGAIAATGIATELRQKVGPVEPVGAEAALYTDEDKVFCVKRMWAEGLTPTAASRLWGAPSRRTLAAWE